MFRTLISVAVILSTQTFGKLQTDHITVGDGTGVFIRKQVNKLQQSSDLLNEVGVFVQQQGKLLTIFSNRSSRAEDRELTSANGAFLTAEGASLIEDHNRIDEELAILKERYSNSNNKYGPRQSIVESDILRILREAEALRQSSARLVKDSVVINLIAKKFKEESIEEGRDEVSTQRGFDSMIKTANLKKTNGDQIIQLTVEVIDDIESL